MADTRTRDRFIPFRKADLYFKNLDNNTGVFYHLIDAAEEEETKEAILAYFFLLTEKQPLTQKELDERIEKWFESRWNTRINFEIDDALAKLDRLGLVNTRDGERLQCQPLKEAKRRLDDIWDNYFRFNQPDSASA